MSSDPQECRTQPVKEKCARCDHTDSCHNIQGIRSRQDYPANRQPRRWMSNRSLQQLHVKDSHDASTLKDISKVKKIQSYRKETRCRSDSLDAEVQLCTSLPW
ncbi:hypothetical protein B9Z55_019740 [Caenorhabditis nigoni]|uniref:Uncharacterized protein n=1 Tax=Caenorhabditis nigoni TaxID=1611254 RepID=A0A2G5TJN3_9PELO|nr:hypothetical protein B9Z55_019740 [Caenorhabditis nigoni]